MALEELCCIDSAINEWVNYRVLSFASTAVGLNEEDSRKKSRFLKKAEIFRNKMPYIEGVYTKNEQVFNLTEEEKKSYQFNC